MGYIGAGISALVAVEKWAFVQSGMEHALEAHVKASPVDLLVLK